MKKVDIERIKQLRKAADITLEDMANRLGYGSPNGYYYLERGRSKFTAETLIAVADILNVRIEELFCEEKKEAKHDVLPPIRGES